MIVFAIIIIIIIIIVTVKWSPGISFISSSPILFESRTGLVDICIGGCKCYILCVCVCHQSIISALDFFFCTNAVLHKSPPMLYSMLLQVVQHTMKNVYIRVNISKLQVLFVCKTNTVEKCTFRIIIKKSYRIKIL